MFVFDHVGLRTTEPQPDENWVEQSRCWVTNPRSHPEHIEFLRYALDTTVPEAVRADPHVVYRVDSIEAHIEGWRSSFRLSSSAISSASSSFASTGWCSSTCSISTTRGSVPEPVWGRHCIAR
jgi:hypothetical protein